MEPITDEVVLYLRLGLSHLNRYNRIAWAHIWWVSSLMTYSTVWLVLPYLMGLEGLNVLLTACSGGSLYVAERTTYY